MDPFLSNRAQHYDTHSTRSSTTTKIRRLSPLTLPKTFWLSTLSINSRLLKHSASRSLCLRTHDQHLQFQENSTALGRQVPFSANHSWQINLPPQIPHLSGIFLTDTSYPCSCCESNFINRISGKQLPAVFSI